MTSLPLLLSEDQVKLEVAKLPSWTGSQAGLDRKLEFEDFRGAMRFMQACVDDIELLNHHPIWKNKYNTIDIHIDTFDVGNRTTDLDIKLAQLIERILALRGLEFGLVAHE